MFDVEKMVTVDPSRVNELHPSSFPYCGLRQAMHEVIEGEPEGEDNLPTQMDFYVSIGTIVHEWVQHRISRAHKLDKLKDITYYFVGDWKCTNRKCGIVTGKHKNPFE